MSPKVSLRTLLAAEKRQQREAKKRQRELERRTKEAAKLSALEHARLEVETYENRLDVLLSVHKEQADPWDWPALAASLPPIPPRRWSHNEIKIREQLASLSSREETAAAIQKAQQQDESEYQDAQQTHAAEYAEWEKLSSLARRILVGEYKAYIEAIKELSPFAEIASIGSFLHFTIHNEHLIECVLRTNGRKAIPSEVKSLTLSGKVSVKPMPKPRFVEVCQDYICGCVLRVARELFALLPIDTLLITASTESLDTSTGQMAERPFLSVVIPRDVLRTLDFDKLDPSDSIMSMTHRGDLKASRKTGDFEFISPLIAAELPQPKTESADLHAVLAAAQGLHAELVKQNAALKPQSEDTVATNGEP